MKRLSNILLLLLVFVLSGCYSDKKQDIFRETGQAEAGFADKFFQEEDLRPIAPAPAKAARAPAEKTIPVKPDLVSMNGSGLYVLSMTHPCADYGIIQLDKTIPKEVGLNKPFDYSIRVTNLTDMALTDVVITEDIPNNFRFTGANPAAEEDANKLVWRMDSLGPRASKQIIVSGIATNIDYLKQCTTVTHVTRAYADVRVVQPKLELAIAAPPEVLLCDPIPVEFVVTNSGTGSEQNVKIISTLPAGLRTIDGKNELVFDAGTLVAGQSRQFSVELRATKADIYANSAVASSASGLKTESETIVTAVRQPVLTIVKTGPKRQYLDRAVTYEITVTNRGDGPAKNAILEDTIPAGATSIEATAGAKFAESRLFWELGTLAPNTSKKVRVSYTPTKVGPLASSATAAACCAEAVTASAMTSVTGIAAVRLEVIDIEDPVEVGGHATYVIMVTNQGSAPDTDIRIVCILEDKLQYVSSAGVTTGSIMGHTVSFAPLRSLAPKAKATWRVVARGLRPGDVRFRVTMNTDQLVRPVEETEATHLYEQYSR